MTRISRSRKPASKSGASSGKDGDSGNETAPPASSPRKPIARSAVVLPLTPHTQVECKWSSNGDKYFLARIVDHRQVKGAEGVWEHYVHYRGFNRRVDEWVSQDKLNLDTVIPPAVVDPSEGASKKRRVEEIHSEEEGEGHSDMEGDLHEHEQITKVKNVGKIELGRYEMDTWYWSPLPAEYHGVEKLYFCEYDLAFFKEREAMLRHLRKVRLLHPPGQEIYRHNGISMFEVDGAVAKTYCENLCYLAKLFLDHKCLDNDTDAFLFYVLCECDERGAHPVGYFSKDKHHLDLNLSCILTLPSYQRRGYGKFLISFSYELSKIAQRVGTPERPLSDLGLVSYRSYWTRVLLNILKDREGSITIKELSDMTMFHTKDIISTLQHLKLIQSVKGQHVICAAPHVIEAHLRACGSPGLEVDPSKIVWVPYVNGGDKHKK